MEENNTFEGLSSKLPQDDKLKFLEKLKTHTQMSEYPLINESEAPSSTEDNKNLYKRLSFFRRLLYRIIAFFSGKNPMEIFVDSLFTAEGKALDLAYPGIYDYQHTLLKQDFQTELKKLKDAARFFYMALDSSFNKNAGDFFVFLGAAELPEINRVLTDGTDPSVFQAEHPNTPMTRLRKNAIDFIEETIAGISDEGRNTMYNNARSLLCLKQLSSFLFDRLILSFNMHNPETGIICSVNLVKNQLITLNNILWSLKTTPSLTLLVSIFVFIMQEHQNEDGFDADAEMQKFSGRAEKALDTIRTFNRHIPLTRVIRCGLKDMSYQPSELSGGEDWFIKYRDSWIKKVNDQFNAYIINKRKAHINSLSADLFGDFKIEPFENIQTAENDTGIPVDGIENVAILMGFHKHIFMPQINIVLRPILINGNFEKKENRIEFTESYNVLIKLDDTIKTFAGKLSASGEFGKRWTSLNSEVQSVTVRKRKSQLLFEEIDYFTTTIIEETFMQLSIMEKILLGILNPAQDQIYGTLSNLSEIAGKGESFMDGLRLALDKLHNMVALVTEIKNINDVD
ncbi:MAG: DUF5312 domain-containing protein [Termitinemataceae bacterium]|nr:MAG: DUF5312 domain-containing protein [Termitinemataceae bacterium]